MYGTLHCLFTSYDLLSKHLEVMLRLWSCKLSLLILMNIVYTHMFNRVLEGFKCGLWKIVSLAGSKSFCNTDRNTEFVLEHGIRFFLPNRYNYKTNHLI